MTETVLFSFVERQEVTVTEETLSFQRHHTIEIHSQIGSELLLSVVES